MDWIKILLIAIIFDIIIGDPPNWPHPIRYIGSVIKVYEKAIRKQKWFNLKVGGFFLTALTLITVVFIVTLLSEVTKIIHPVFNSIVSIYFTYTALATKCLHVEAKKVYTAVKSDDIKLSRKMLSYIVGRETTNLNYQEIIRGAVETVAENTIDGVLAPMFYFIVGVYIGYPVHMIILYKTINTLDSMVGYIQESYKDIGYASAKLDDIANFIPARVGSILMLLSGFIFRYNVINGAKILIRDRRNHKSPNCGYPESVVAGLLDVQLGGSNTYFGQILYKPTIGDKNKKLTAINIVDSIKIMYGAQCIFILLILLMIFI
ncbi:adenosylcobinamide-phosphate synthase CbiB [Caldisalinibacter kiritimatiensis]|uniref:Cobalamin biosynthesis protein CobD n=1 Tax=Caldisalinibacter kiritimatiensis TaxID=1304284 RepID=R1CEL8_9FIRM|nr:adenosylcobinamide-phosphate synthase CbiB [Caldisalinibacter kiritimatiensis]EOD00745.1 Adenosylcobinamide-phosphate synthase [Caldisalinibacter kiritimatiensis]